MTMIIKERSLKQKKFLLVAMVREWVQFKLRGVLNHKLKSI